MRETLVKPLLARYHDLYKDPETRVKNLVEIISEIREPITNVTDEEAVSQEQRRQDDIKVYTLHSLSHKKKNFVHERCTKCSLILYTFCNVIVFFINAYIRVVSLKIEIQPDWGGARTHNTVYI